MSRFLEKYGPWALIAGASEGLGAAFAHSLAARGMNLILLARRISLLETLASELEGKFKIEARCLQVDLGNTTDLENLPNQLDVEVGLLVYNAAYSPIEYFKDIDTTSLLNIIDVNVRAPIYLTKLISQGMVELRKGGIVLMSSLAGNQGSPKIATYAATKAFNTILAEGLWQELGEHNVDVIASIAGAIRTPGYDKASTNDAPGTLDAPEVVEKTLAALGKGPVIIPGFFNRFATFLMEKCMPRRQRIKIMYNNTKDLT